MQSDGYVFKPNCPFTGAATASAPTKQTMKFIIKKKNWNHEYTNRPTQIYRIFQTNPYSIGLSNIELRNPTNDCFLIAIKHAHTKKKRYNQNLGIMIA